MNELRNIYIEFQQEPTIPHKILYLQQNQEKLSKYNINIPNLIQAWENNDWPWSSKNKKNRTDYL